MSVEERRVNDHCDEHIKASDTQVGGDHYKGFVIQPGEFITKNDIGFFPGSIIKRACRFDKSSGKGLEDLEKIIHEAQLIMEYGGWEEDD